MIKYLILGAIQGIFEWLPISSEGIVALSSQWLIKGSHPVDVALFLHLGTLMAVLIYFWKDWKEILTLRNKKLLRFLIIATVVSSIIGYPLYKLIRNVAIGSTLLVIMGFGLLLTAYSHKKEKKLEINFTQLSVISGFLQGLSVIPGLSRSGSTIFGLSLGNLSPSEILKTSYIMSAPVVLGLSGYMFLENKSLVFEGFPALISSFLVGIVSLHFLISASKKINFFKFALGFAILCFLGAILI